MLPAAFPIYRVTVAHQDRRDEQLGTKAKFWFDRAGSRTLFKRGRANEDWSEKVASECAHLLGLPHAVVELAVCDGLVGILSPSFLDKGDHLVHGNELLLQIDRDYPFGQRYHMPQHTLTAVLGALEKLAVSVPPRAARDLPVGFDGRDLFCGLLVLDAWTGNSDRHHENWAVIDRRERRYFAPAYDHASSLGRNETPLRIATRLAGTDPRVTVDSYALKCRSALYSSDSATHPMTTIEAARAAMEQRPAAAAFWRSRLQAVDDGRIDGLLERVPAERIADGSRRFAAAILRFNRKRILMEQNP